MSKEKLISAGFLIQSKDKYLLGHASGRGMTKGWGIPKGKQDKGETLLETAIRETFEETALPLQLYPPCILEVETSFWTTFDVGN